MQKAENKLGTPESRLTAPQETGISVGDVVRMLGAHLWLIVVCAALCVTASAVYVRFQIPIYEASSTIRLDPGRATSLGLGDLISVPSGDQSDDLHTEIAIIKSDGVAIRALNSLEPEMFRDFAGFTREFGDLPENGSNLSARSQSVLDRLKAQTAVKQEEGTQLVDIKFRDRNPQIAATIANSLVSAYQSQSVSSRTRSVSHLKEWLTSQMDDLKRQVDSNQNKLADFQLHNGILTTTDAHNTITDRLNQLNSKLTDAEANRIGKEAQMRAADGINDPVQLESQFPSPKLQSLQTEQVQVSGQYEQLAAKFGQNYPPLVEKRKQLAKIDAEIAAIISSIQQQLRQEYEAADRTETLLKKEYQNQSALAYGLNSQEAKYAEMQGDVTSARELYATLQRKLQQATVDTQVNSVETVIVDSARAPTFPIEPKKSLIIVSGLFLGLFAGTISAFVFESTSDHVRNSERIESALGYPALATIPRDSKKRAISGEMIPLVTLQHPLSEDAESYRMLRSSLLPYQGGTVKIILFASALPGEGLGTVAANFAVCLAQTGSRVLLVDADLRHPSFHEEFGVENGLGLGNYLSGSATSVLVRQPLSQFQNLGVVTAGDKPPLPSESLSSERFHLLSEKWGHDYDFILVKSAPLLMVSDGLSLASWADSTVLVVRHNASKLAAVAEAGRMLSRSNAKVAGFVLVGGPLSIGVHVDRTAYRKEYYG